MLLHSSIYTFIDICLLSALGLKLPGPLDEYGYSGQSILLAAAEEDLHEAFEELNIKKPHRRLILKAFEAGFTASEPQASTQQEKNRGGIDGPPQQPVKQKTAHQPRKEAHDVKEKASSVHGLKSTCTSDFETHFSNKAMVNAQQWFDNFTEQSRADGDQVTDAASKGDFAMLTKMCRQGDIDDDAKVYGTVPLLNWLGQYIGRGPSDSIDGLLKCLIASGLDMDPQPPFSDDALQNSPLLLRIYRNYPLLLQAVETKMYSIVTALLLKGGSLTSPYRLPDGRSSGMTSLHASQRLSDPNDMIHTINDR
jgi:hypothetical protein